MKKLVLALALAAAGALFFRLQGIYGGATEFFVAAAMVWGLSLSLLNSFFDDWKRGKARLTAE